MKIHLTLKYMRGNGRMVNRTVKVDTYFQMELVKWVFGRKVVELNG